MLNAKKQLRRLGGKKRRGHPGFADGGGGMSTTRYRPPLVRGDIYVVIILNIYFRK